MTAPQRCSVHITDGGPIAGVDCMDEVAELGEMAARGIQAERVAVSMNCADLQQLPVEALSLDIEQFPIGGVESDRTTLVGAG